MDKIESLIKSNTKFLEGKGGRYLINPLISTSNLLTAIVAIVMLLGGGLMYAYDHDRFWAVVCGSLLLVFLAACRVLFRLLKKQTALRRHGRIVFAEVVSVESPPEAKNSLHMELVYRLAPEEGGILGEAAYASSPAAMRRPEVGETIPIMFASPELHSPI